MVKTRTWILIIAALLVISGAAWFWASTRPAPGKIANIYQDGVCVRSIDLNAVTQAQSFTVTGPSGSNTVLVEPGRICVLDADCPDQVCVASGWLSDSAAPIVCLPHKLVIQLEDSSAAQENGMGQLDTVSK